MAFKDRLEIHETGFKFLNYGRRVKYQVGILCPACRNLKFEKIGECRGLLALGSLW